MTPPTIMIMMSPSSAAMMAVVAMAMMTALVVLLVAGVVAVGAGVSVDVGGAWPHFRAARAVDGLRLPERIEGA